MSTRPIAVYKEDSTWRWRCRLPMCNAGDWEPNQRRAVRRGVQHLDRHKTFGVRGKG